MIDVWECIAEDSPAKAQEISAFCAEAFETLNGRDESDQAPAEILRESSSRWGDYLRLIDPESDSATDWNDTPPGPDPDRDDAPAAIDPGALFRMLTGDTSRSEIDDDVIDRSLEKRDKAASAAPIASGLFSLSGSWPTIAGDAEPVAVAAAPSRSIASAPPFEVPAPPLSLAIDQELSETFLAEASDLFDRIETLVLSLGRGQRPTVILHELGRCFHTLKGAAGSVGLVQLAALVHAMEEQLEETAGEANDSLIDLLHRLLHYLEGVFIALRRGGQPVPQPSTSAIEPKPCSPPTADVSRTDVAPPALPSPAMAEAPTGEGPVRVSADRIDELMDLASELITRRGLWTAQAEAMKKFATQAKLSRNRLMTTVDRLRDLRPSNAASASAAGTPTAAFDHDADLPELIRRLTEQAEDLTVLTDAANTTAQPLSDNSESLARLSLLLWESLQAIRILPVRGLFQRLVRVAHDASRVEGRPVEVVMVGEEIGLDRAVQDKAFEPLLHVVRNAVSHGIDPPEERRKAGKPATGLVTLEAARSGNSIVLSVQDDGRGLDYNAIASKGRRLGLIGPADIPTTERLNALIFQAGFSTREEANAIAGRGVGMDVVSQEVGRLHGSVVLGSEAGKGTKLSISLPSRLSLQQAMVLRVDGQAFALPVELIDLAQPFDPEAVDRSGKYPMALMRDHLVPLVAAREALGISSAPAVSCPKLLLIRADGGPLAVLADAIDGIRELVLKPLGPLLLGHPLISGTSLSVTGEVIFALNPSGLARWPRVEEERSEQAPAAAINAPRRAAPILVVDDSISVRKVVARRLRAMGHEVEEVSDGLEALGRIRNFTYGLVLSDLEMPRMDGFELLAELSRLAIAPAVPVVVASTRSDAETRRRVLSLGARQFIPKPIEPDVLAALVQDLFPGHAGIAPGAA